MYITTINTRCWYCSTVAYSCCLKKNQTVTVVVVVVVSHIQRIGCQPEKTTLHGGQSCSWSAEQGKKKERKSVLGTVVTSRPGDNGLIAISIGRRNFLVKKFYYIVWFLSFNVFPLVSSPTKLFTRIVWSSLITEYVCMYVCMVITYSRVWINRVRLPILLVVS